MCQDNEILSVLVSQLSPLTPHIIGMYLHSAK